MRFPYNGQDGRARRNNPALHPEVYGREFKQFAAAMKAVDPNIHVGAVVHWPFTEYSRRVNQVDWDENVLPHACASMDLGSNHWYPGDDILTGMLTIPRREIPRMFAELRAEMAQPAMGCGDRGADMPIAITEWGPNIFYKEVGEAYNPKQPDDPNAPRVPLTRTQIGGIFAAESYAHFMEQGATAVHWLQLHSDGYLQTQNGVDVPRFGYHGAQMAHYLAATGDQMVPASSEWSTVLAHASRHADGKLAVMLSNINWHREISVNVKLDGATKVGPTGVRYAYTPIGRDLDGTVSDGEPISSSDGGASITVPVPPYSVVVVVFPPA